MSVARSYLDKTTSNATVYPLIQNVVPSILRVQNVVENFPGGWSTLRWEFSAESNTSRDVLVRHSRVLHGIHIEPRPKGRPRKAAKQVTNTLYCITVLLLPLQIADSDSSGDCAALPINNSLDNRIASEPIQIQAEPDSGLPSQSTNDALDPQLEMLLGVTTSETNNVVSIAPTSYPINARLSYPSTLYPNADFLNTSAGTQPFFDNASYPLDGKKLAKIDLCQCSGSHKLTNGRL
jgi:hypothetical protein